MSAAASSDFIAKKLQTRKVEVPLLSHVVSGGGLEVTLFPISGQFRTGLS
jgi:hypothetical protein